MKINSKSKPKHIEKISHISDTTVDICMVIGPNAHYWMLY